MICTHTFTKLQEVVFCSRIPCIIPLKSWLWHGVSSLMSIPWGSSHVHLSCVSHEHWGSVRGASTFSQMQILTSYVFWGVHLDKHADTYNYTQTPTNCKPAPDSSLMGTWILISDIRSTGRFGAKIHAIRQRTGDLFCSCSGSFASFG